MPQVPKYSLKELNLDGKTIGQRLTNIRKKKGMSQSEIAELIGISQRLVSNYEVGRLNITADMVTRFAIALTISADEILGLKKIENDTSNLSLRLTRRMREIDNLSEQKKKAILKTIDDLIRANK